MPATGELIDTRSIELPSIALRLQELADLERDLRSAKRAFADALALALDHEGRRSVEVDGFRLEINAPTEREWDLDELRATLAELVEEGTITDAKAKACIRWDPKAVWSELKILLTDPRCKARIGHAMAEVPTTRYAKVRRG